MYATMHRTEQWFSHHHLALAALIALLAALVLGGLRYVTLPAPAPAVTEIPAPSAAYSAAVTRYQGVKAQQAEMLDRMMVPAPSAAFVAAQARYQTMKERQADMQDRTTAFVASVPMVDARQRYQSAKEQQADMRDTTMVPPASIAVTAAQQRFLDMKERQAETRDRSTAPASSITLPASVARYENAKERQAAMQDRTGAVTGPTAAENAQYQWQMNRLQEMNTSGDPELDAGLLPGAYSDARSGPH